MLSFAGTLEFRYSLHAEVLKLSETFRYTLGGRAENTVFRGGEGPIRSCPGHSPRNAIRSGGIWSDYMDVIKMLAELRQERDQLEEAILTLERLARGRGRRRGRPPAWMTELKRRGRPPGSKNKAKESAAA
jgi:hypothetical protein